MCQFKSGIILKDRVFVPDYDSHTDMLTELGIKDDYIGASKKFVRAELIPQNGDVFTDIETWRFKVDQDITPDWFNPEEYRPRMIEAVKEWAKDHIHIGVDGLKISSGTDHYIKDCKDVEICGSASIKYVCGSASIENVCGSASIENVCGSASIKYVCGSASIKYVRGSASIENVCGSASIENVCGSASIKYVCGSASIKYAKGQAVICSSAYSRWERSHSLILCENATFKDNYGRVIYQSGDYKLVSVERGKEIGNG